MTSEEKNKLAEENLGLVYLVVNKEFTYEKTTESDRENYIEEGMIGVEKNTIKHRIDKAKIKLIELGITA